MSRAASCIALALAVALAPGCKGHGHATAAPQVGKALGAALAAADHARAPWRCTGDDLPLPSDPQLPHWKVEGHVLRLAEGDAPVTIAVVADAGGAAPATIAALGALRAKLAEDRPQLVLALGGMGATQQELEATLGALATPGGAPVIALPGDLEPMPAQVAAIAALRGKGAPVLDGRLVREIEVPGATIATIPGAGARERLVASIEGCSWTADDVQKLYAALAGRPGVRIAAAAEAPRGTSHGMATGELALVPAPAQVDVVLHGPADAAPTPARSGTRDGKAIALAPGTADATTRLPDPHVPSAGLLVVRGGSWTWRPVRQPSE